MSDNFSIKIVVTSPGGKSNIENIISLHGCVSEQRHECLFIGIGPYQIHYLLSACEISGKEKALGMGNTLLYSSDPNDRQIQARNTSRLCQAIFRSF